MNVRYVHFGPCGETEYSSRPDHIPVRLIEIVDDLTEAIYQPVDPADPDRLIRPPGSGWEPQQRQFDHWRWLRVRPNKIVAAKSPRNLRRHTARVLIIDEATIHGAQIHAGNAASPTTESRPPGAPNGLWDGSR